MSDCPHFTVKRAKYFTVSPLKDLFYHVNPHVIFDFIKYIGFYNRLGFHTSFFLFLFIILFLPLLVKFLNHYDSNSLIVLMRC